MSKIKSFISIFIPSATVFVSSFCIMALELAAGRLTSQYLGSSLYTWTSVIGVILTGITIGNYAGGRIADKFNTAKSISLILAFCSVSCVLTIILNNTAGKLMLLWNINWPMHIFIHITLLFLIPSVLLGMISPLAAKAALDRGLSKGRTIGDIYAWSAAGSIAGTFAAGYWLISAIGTINIIWATGALLLLTGILYRPRFVPLFIWAAIYILLTATALLPGKWAQKTGAIMALREQQDSKIIYEDESRYFHITIREPIDNPDKLAFYQDKLEHSVILKNDVYNLQYFYTKIYAAITEGLSGDRKTISTMSIGGGGYVFPRYIEKVFPGSRIDVIEIDPAVTEAAIKAFGLKRDSGINTINMDARNYVDKLLEQKSQGQEKPKYDFVYGDAFNDYSVPFQLVTRQFDEKISEILNENGAYILNVIDIFDSGLFLGSVVNTLKQVFPFVYVVTGSDATPSFRNTFVIIASKQKLDLKNIISQYKGEKLSLWYLSAADIEKLGQKSKQLVLTDDYCPVENLLAPVVRSSSEELSVQTLLKRANELQQKGRYAESIENYLLAIKANPAVSVPSYNEIGIMYSMMNNMQKASEAFYKAVQYSEQFEHKNDIANTRYNLGMVLMQMGKQAQASEQFNKAIGEFRQELIIHPTSVKIWRDLGDTLAITGNIKEATEAFRKALDLNPNEPVNYENLIKALAFQGRNEEQIELLKKYIQFMKANKQDDRAAQLENHLKSIESKNNK